MNPVKNHVWQAVRLKDVPLIPVLLYQHLFVSFVYFVVNHFFIGAAVVSTT